TSISRISALLYLYDLLYIYIYLFQGQALPLYRLSPLPPMSRPFSSRPPARSNLSDPRIAICLALIRYAYSLWTLKMVSAVLPLFGGSYLIFSYCRASSRNVSRRVWKGWLW